MLRVSIAIGLLCTGGVVQAESFHGHDCKSDCAAHRAGYEWAEAHDISDVADCSGDSEAFIEGCKAFVRDGETDEDLDNGDDDSEHEDDGDEE
jgi:hypothetical protein